MKGEGNGAKDGDEDDEDDDEYEDDSNYRYRDESSTFIDEDPESSIARLQENHPMDTKELMKSIRDGKSHARGHFSHHIDDLPVLRNLNGMVDLDEMKDLEYLTEGSHSHIFSAHWKGQPVIIKMLQADKADNAIAQYEFDIEAELLSRMDHPRVIRSLGSGKVPRPFIILERLKDASSFLDLNPAADDQRDARQIRLFQAPSTKPALSLPQVLHVARDLADALNYCHSGLSKDAMIIHRDLKPENLGLTVDNRAKLFDFGLCRCVKKRRSEDDTYEMTGNTGSLRYMAPEVVLNKPYTEKVDVYSFAMVIWALARGKPPFKGFDRDMHRIRVVESGERPKLERSWPREFCDLLVACWQKTPHQRPSFATIYDHLNQMIEGGGKDRSAAGRAQSLFKKISTTFSSSSHK